MLKSLVEALLVLWPLWLLIGLVGAGKLAFELYRLRRLAKSGISEIDAMDGRMFEQFLGTLFRRFGYQVETTRYQSDYGADLVVKKDGLKTAVQAKRWTKRVGVKAVQEAVAAKGYYGCDEALVVANRDFTRQAYVLARANKVELWNRGVLVEKLLAVRREAAASPPVIEAEAAPTPFAGEVASVSLNGGGRDPAHCVTCGVAVSEKVRDYCLARQQRFGGEVVCFKHQRGVGRLARTDASLVAVARICLRARVVGSCGASA